MAYMIDGLQYANWSEKIFQEMRAGAVDAVHVTITYHENFRETVHNIERWNRWFEQYPDLIFHGRTAACVKLHVKPTALRSFSDPKIPAVSKTISVWSRCCTPWVCGSCN